MEKSGIVNKGAKLALALVAALVLAGGVWLTLGHNPDVPTAAAPRGAFASDRASEEPALPPKP